MNRSANDLRITVVAPTGRDSELICRLLQRNGTVAMECPDWNAACREVQLGIGALLIVDEVLNRESTSALGRVIAEQPSWSDLPVIVLTGGGQVTLESEARRRMREPLGNVLLVERPVRPETLVSMVKSAIRARTRQYQARDAADAIRKSEKLAVAGRLAASIAHEINNPLEAVTNLLFLMRSATSLESMQEYLALADHELQRVSEITRQTLRFYRQSSTVAPVELSTVLDSILKLYGRRLEANRIVVLREYEGDTQVMGVAGELRQVTANLVSNALDAMPTGGTLHIRIRPARHANRNVTGVRLLVADTGCGIPSGVRERILEPFVSTKQDTGTGLGLWVTSEIVRKHGGVIRYRSRVGKGTVFSVFLPREAPNAETRARDATGTAAD